MTPFDPTSAMLDPAAAGRRLEAIDQALFGLRTFRAEVERVRPGLMLDRIDGWHSDAAGLYADRATEVRYALAGAEHLLLEAETELAAELERVRAAGAVGGVAGAATPRDGVSVTGVHR